MYAKDAYHDIHYKEKESDAYSASARLLRQHMSPGSLVLDYGCGLGAFLKALKSSGFVPYGVEFDSDAGRFAKQNVGCEVLPVNEFHELPIKPTFDVIHLGDVLEHLSDPTATLSRLLDHLRPGGIVFVEGPLEINPSPVYWAARLYGIIKLVIKPGFVPNDPPLHLFRTEARAQLAFFKAFAISPVLWRVYETGWPYATGGVVKRAIARLAVILSGRRLFNVTFGNRFEGLFVKLSNKFT
jgi:SAM-dependent methyltransferase